MVPIFIVHARQGLLGVDALVVAASVSKVLFGPWVLAPALSCLTGLSACCAVSSVPALSTGLVVAVLVASSLTNCALPPLGSPGLLIVGNSGKSLKAYPKCYIQ
jgi:hypothetical protein